MKLVSDLLDMVYEDRRLNCGCPPESSAQNLSRLDQTDAAQCNPALRKCVPRYIDMLNVSVTSSLPLPLRLSVEKEGRRVARPYLEESRSGGKH